MLLSYAPKFQHQRPLSTLVHAHRYSLRTQSQSGTLMSFGKPHGFPEEMFLLSEALNVRLVSLLSGNVPITDLVMALFPATSDPFSLSSCLRNSEGIPLSQCTSSETLYLPRSPGGVGTMSGLQERNGGTAHEKCLYWLRDCSRSWARHCKRSSKSPITRPTLFLSPLLCRDSDIKKYSNEPPPFSGSYGNR